MMNEKTKPEAANRNGSSALASAHGSASFCPATMCPMFAKSGSPWTGEHNAQCSRTQCGWWQAGQCSATEWALDNLAEEKPGKSLSKVPHCTRAHECQWQLQAEWLCPPRFAAVNGMDPRACSW